MSIKLLFTFILSYILFSISSEDIKTMLISEKKLRVFAFFGILYLMMIGVSTSEKYTINLIIKNLLSMITIFLFMLSISYLGYKLFRVNSLGLGDIKISSIGALWLGLELSFTALAISFFLSSIYSIYNKITNRFERLHQYPFAPFLSIGIFCSWILDKI